jgi:hypothetical protein
MTAERHCSLFLQMLQSHLQWERIPGKIKRAIEHSLEHLDEHRFTLTDTHIEMIDDYCWDISKNAVHTSRIVQSICTTRSSQSHFQTAALHELGTQSSDQ